MRTPIIADANFKRATVLSDIAPVPSLEPSYEDISEPAFTFDAVDFSNSDLLSAAMEPSIILDITATAADQSERLDKFIARAGQEHNLSRSRAKALILDGQLRCDGRTLTDPSASVKSGAIYQLEIPPAADPTPQAEDIPLTILFEDEHLILIDKPVGMVVHPAPGAMTGTLVNALIAHCGDSLTGIGGVARPGIVHRLDKDTSGVMVVAKTDEAHHRLSKRFAKHDMDRRYQALVWGMPAERHSYIDAPLGRHRTDRKRQAVRPDGKHAITHYSTLRDLPPIGCLVECVLETGRTHQIRVHMSHIGHGLIGDPVYGRPLRAAQMPDQTSRDLLAKLRNFERQALHAAKLEFDHPITGQLITGESPLPDDMQGLLADIDAAIAKRAAL